MSKQVKSRTGLHRALRILGACAVLALTVGIVLGARALPASGDVSANPVDVAVPAAEVALVCPGQVAVSTIGSSDSELSGASDISGAVSALVIAREEGLHGASFGALGEVGEPLTEGPDAAVATRALSSEPTLLRTEPGAQAAWALAATSQRADSGDARGLAAVPCPVPASSQWFAAGRTTIGDSAVLTLRNPGATPATVTLRAWDATGEVPLDTTPWVVPPDAEVSQVLEALVPDVDRLVFSVTSSGGQVSATMQTLQLDGLTPNGTDLVSPTAGPSQQVLIPGIVIVSSEMTPDDPSVVRLLNTGTEPANLTVSLLGPEGAIDLTPDGMVVEPNAVSDVSLAGTPAGTYVASVTSDQPLVAGAQLVRVGTPAPEDPDVPVTDRAWLTAVAPTEVSGLALADAPAQSDRALLVFGRGPQLEDDSGAGQVRVIGYNAEGVASSVREFDVEPNTSYPMEIADLGEDAVGLQVIADIPVSVAAVFTAQTDTGELITVMPTQGDPQVDRYARMWVSLN